VLHVPFRGSATTEVMSGAIVLPAGTPTHITNKFSQAMQSIAADPVMNERFLVAGARITSGTPEQTVAHAARDQMKWKEVVRVAGAKVE
jgi:tripartite-type tricarboxylate transporter receptor subunit TctC